MRQTLFTTEDSRHKKKQEHSKVLIHDPGFEKTMYASRRCGGVLRACTGEGMGWGLNVLWLRARASRYAERK